MTASDFPRYFALGGNYSPLRGYVRCDNEHSSHLLVSSSNSDLPIPLQLDDCLSRVTSRRMVEMTKEAIERMDALWVTSSHILLTNGNSACSQVEAAFFRR